MQAATPDLSLSYTQFARLPETVAGQQDSQAGLEAAARQFESICIDMWLKGAREANQVFAENNITNSSEMLMQQEMLDHEMAVHMSQNGGIGLAPVIVRQLGGDPSLMSGAAQPPSPAQGAWASSTVSAVTGNPARPGANARISAFDNPGDFVKRIKPLIDSALKNLPIPGLAVLGQAALETGWGAHVIADSTGNLSHNLFGIKAKAAEPSVAVVSKEFEHGRWLHREDNFRTYPDWRAGISDYVDKITQSPRYRGIATSVDDIQGYLQGLQEAGYATDPGYADKIMRVVASIKELSP